MKYYILILGIFFIVFALTEAKCPDRCQINVPSKSVCIVQKDPEQCLKIKECTLSRMNCVRWRQNIPPLVTSNLSRCALIGGPTGSGRCTTAQDRCKQINCAADKVLRCQRVGNKCRLLTNCVAKRENCRNRRDNQLKPVAKRFCQGLKSSYGLRSCKMPKKKKRKKLFG